MSTDHKISFFKANLQLAELSTDIKEEIVTCRLTIYARIFNIQVEAGLDMAINIRDTNGYHIGRIEPINHLAFDNYSTISNYFYIRKGNVFSLYDKSSNRVMVKAMRSMHDTRPRAAGFDFGRDN